MSVEASLVDRFEGHRAHLRSVAYRMLGSLSEADDALQEAWIRLSRADATTIDNLGGWLTTVVARICLDMLRSRTSRREEALDGQPASAGEHGPSPEQEALLADSVGLALLVVLGALEPAERVAFVLHDMFAVPFDEIALILGRSPVAARQLASRARTRVRGSPAVPDADLVRQRAVVDAFLAASREGDFEALVAVLDPDAVFRPDPVLTAGTPSELRGAPTIAKQFAGRAVLARTALVDGRAGIVVAPHGQLLLVIGVTFRGDRIAALDVIADPDRLAGVALAVGDGVP
jgi:RNA polymerase sigma-70 factor, ECF subfamily